jgi:hypothetical protein
MRIQKHGVSYTNMQVNIQHHSRSEKLDDCKHKMKQSELPQQS